MKSAVITTVILVLVAAAVFINVGTHSTPAYADTKTAEELSLHMDHMRRQTHKLGLAIGAKNKPLAAYYVNEINEQVARIQAKFPTYDGLQIAALAKAMLDPYMGPLKTAVDAGNWATAGPAYEKLITAGCNGCHTATQRPFIKITSSATNPYNQDFKP